jgi:hypothetical protein
LLVNAFNNITLTLRRRDGQVLCGGYNHGEVRFVCPSQYEIDRQVNVDKQLLTSLLSAREQSSSIFDLLISVMGLLELANTDNDNMTHPSEIILMGSALETFLEIEGNQKAFKLGQAFNDLFSSFSSRTAQDAIDNSRSVFIDPKAKGAQPNNWSILQTWAHEFYQLRNEHAHAKETPNRTWGWSDLEYLTFAAFSFPLMVKAKLAKDGLYSLTKIDEQKCFALGELLITTGWRDDSPYDTNNTWTRIINDAFKHVLY